MLKASLLAGFGWLVLPGCEESEIYNADAPDWINDSIAAVAARNASSGASQFLEETVTSDGWWTAWSSNYTLSENQRMTMTIGDFTSGRANLWDNWAFVTCNTGWTERNGDGYYEYFVVRGDGGNWNGSGGSVSVTTPDEMPIADASYIDFMQDGTTWTIVADHYSTGKLIITCVGTNPSGETYTWNAVGTVDKGSSVWVFMAGENSSYTVKNVEYETLDDLTPVSISVSGVPTSVEVVEGEASVADFFGNGVATVVWSNGSSSEVSVEDLAFSTPDLTTVGTQMISVAYSKTSQGNYCQAVATSYLLEVTNPVVSIAVSQLPTMSKYYYFSTDSVVIDVAGMEVTATYADGSTGDVPLDKLTIEKAVPTTGVAKVSYEGASGTVETDLTLEFEKIGIEQVGASDFSSPWWQVFTSADRKVAAGDSVTFKLYCYSDNLANWHSPCTILRRADLSENAVVRMDNFGWGDGYGTAVLASDWDWDTFMANMNGSYIEITVVNNGDGTANIHYNVTYYNGETHFQNYDGITVDSDDLQTGLVTEESYLVIVE